MEFNIDTNDIENIIECFDRQDILHNAKLKQIVIQEVINKMYNDDELNSVINMIVEEVLEQYEN